MKKFSAHLTSINNYFQEQGRRRVVRASNVKVRQTWGRLFYTFLLFFLFAGLSSEKAFGQINAVGNSTAFGGNNVTAVTINVPTGTAEGNVMIALVSSRGNPTITAPGGWVLVGNRLNGTTMTTSVYYRVATAGEPASYTWTLSASHRAAGNITTFSGVNTSNPINVFASLANAASLTITAPSVTTTVDNAMLIGLFSAAYGNNDVIVNAPLTNRPNAVAGSGAAGNGMAVGAGIQTFATAGATGTRSATIGNEVLNIGFLVALTPTPPPPTQLVFTSSEADLASNTTRELRVEVRDASNNLVSGDNDRTITFEKTSGTGTVTGLGTAQTVNGVATLTVTGQTAGSITIRATASGLTEDTTTFTIIAGDPAVVSVEVQPTQTTAGQAIGGPPAAKVVDGANNPVSGVNVTVSEQGGYSFDSGTLTVSTGGDGIATFSNLVINDAGTYTLVFDAAGVDTDATSNAFDVVPADPDAGGSSFVVDPETITTAETSTITITVRDVHGNIRTAGGDDLFITASLGTLSSSTPTDNADGTYTATFSSTSTGEATIRVYLGIDALGDEITPAETVTITAATFFSRTDGNWNVATSWSNAGFGGAAAGRAPSTDDVVRIGDSDTITMTAGETNNQSVSVEATGTLLTGAFVLGGTGSFSLASGATIGVGSADGITASGASGSIQSSGTRTFDVAANYVYNGSGHQFTGSGLPNPLEGNLTINNSAHVSASESLRINGELNLSSGSFIIGSGLTLIANTKDYTGGGNLDFRQKITAEDLEELEFDGTGYRMISSPIASSTFENFLSGLVTKEYAGSVEDPNTNQPTVLWYDETFAGTDNQRWRAPENGSDVTVAGLGYFVYVFEDDGPELSVEGEENVATSGNDFTWPVTHTPAGDDGWNLLGNPFGAALPIGNLVRDNIDATIYVWDPITNQFLADNGETGQLTEQKIAPFQAFWVKANAAGPSLSFSLENRASGGAFVGKQRMEPKKEEVPVISLLARHSDRLQSASHFMFSEGGLLKMNTYDGHRLLPPSGVNSYLEFYSRKEKENRLAINNLPRKFGRPLEIPLEINAYRNGRALAEDITIEVNELKNIPDGWSIELINEKTGERFPIHSASPEYPTTPGSSAKKVTVENRKIVISMDHMAGQEVERTNAAGKVVTSRKDAHIRFTLRIDPGIDAEGLSREFYLHQNYPNPFNPTTTFSFDLALPSEVRLEIYDTIGRRVAVLVNDNLQAGSHRAVWDASHLSSGMYIARLITHDGAFVRKMTLIK